MQPQDTTIPLGLCCCGCGLPTRLAPKTSVALGIVKGQPLRYLNGHQARAPRPSMQKRVPRVCLRCGAAFFAFPSSIRKGGGRYCSDACRGRVRGPRAVRFWAKVAQDGIVPACRSDLGSCWPWQGRVDRITHYGLFEGTTAHRWAYILTYGDPGPGLDIDHLCRVRVCCNPSHLEAVTRQVHMQRSLRALQTHCLRGHPFNAENTRIDPNGTRHCKACKRYTSQQRRVST